MGLSNNIITFTQLPFEDTSKIIHERGTHFFPDLGVGTFVQKGLGGRELVAMTTSH